MSRIEKHEIWLKELYADYREYMEIIYRNQETFGERRVDKWKD